MQLKRIIPPITEPVLLSDIKEYLSLDDGFDNTIKMLISAGREAAEDYQNRSYMQQTFELVYNCFPAIIEFPHPPLIEVEKVEYFATDGITRTIDIDNFVIDTSGQIPKMTLKYGIQYPLTTLQHLRGFVVTYKAGETTIDKVPSKVKQAISMYATWHFDHRDGTENQELFDKAFKNLLNADRVMNI